MKKLIMICFILIIGISNILLAEGDVYVIKKIEFQEINTWYANYIKNAVKQAEKEGASLIILELDTPGGAVSDALNIKNTLIESKVPVVTYINKNAISAGALISLSTKAIYMSDGSLIGAATPIYIKDGKIEKAGEKEVSVMRAAMRSSAEINGKNIKASEAMVDESIVLTKAVDGINLDDKTLLTISTDEAIEINIADAKANSVSEILEIRGLPKDTNIKTIEKTKYDEISKFMLSPIVLMVLLAMGIMGAYIEIRTPGFGIGGAISIIGFSLFFFAQVSLGEATWIGPLVFILGVILILVELFVIPGFGFTGIAGVVAIFASIFISFGITNIVQGSYVVLFALLLSSLLMIILARFLPKSTLMQKISLTTDTKNYSSSASYDDLLNLEGLAFTLLRPAGTIIVNGKKYDAISESEFIEKDSKLIVTKVEGNKIVVTKL